MNRRFFLFSLLGMSGAAHFASSRLSAQPLTGDVDNPYESVDWSNCRYIHSMSHQHSARNDAAIQAYYDMGYRHLAFSNYYPSAPTYPLSAKFLAQSPDAIGCPNAEHHSYLDTNLHANALGSLLATGYGESPDGEQLKATPIIARFENVHVFNANERPGAGVYRLDIATKKIGASDGKPTITIEGATECAFDAGFTAKGEVRARPLAVGTGRFYLRATSPTITVTLDYDKAQVAVTQFRLMQGTNRPWREVFRAALDGEVINGQREGGLLYADGGGITLNHPTGNVEEYSAMLDFDPRVLGIEVWNQLTTGFGSTVGFYDTTPGPHLHFYNLWDDLLKSGRRCLGFFVKDHLSAGRGRNVLLMPDVSGLPMAERERAALRAYRNGAFFGLIAAPATGESGNNVAAPFDNSAFRFLRITLRRDGNGRPIAVDVAVAGNDAAKRPNIQIRFITENGVEHVADAAQAEFALGARPGRKFVRVEAFAYPRTHNEGEALTQAAFRQMNVYDISLVHDKRATGGPTFFGKDQEFPARIPIVDMLFSQPIRFLR